MYLTVTTELMWLRCMRNGVGLLHFLKAQKIMMEGLVKEAGVFRSKGVGVYAGKIEYVSTQVLEKICRTLNCNIEDVCEFVKDDKEVE